MKRDGATTSLWQQAMPDYVEQSRSISTQIFDVVIVGGGITGITTGLLLQKEGKSCMIAEAHNLCFGTTGGTTAHINTFFDNTYDIIKNDFGEVNAQLVARATRQAVALFHQHVNEYKIECGFEIKDGYVYSQDTKHTEELHQVIDASLQAGVDVAFANSIPVPVAFQKAIVYHGQAQLHPAQYVYALAKAFEDAGGVLAQQCTVTNVNSGDVLDIQCNRGTIRARHLVYATHIPPGINLLHFRNAPYRSYAMAVTLKSGRYPDALVYDMYDPYHYIRTQDVDGKKYLIVGGEDHKAAHVKNTEASFTKLESYVRGYFDVEDVAFRWSSEYFEPSDGLAYIGHLPGNPENVYVATGFGGNGITYSHIAAITLSDLITKGYSVYKELFNPGRIKPVAGFASFVKENAGVVKDFVGKRLSEKSLTALAGLAPGDAQLVKYEGKSIALYKDESGVLHALNPVCPHAKCVVDWNSAEKSWDCPCHGSRFSYDGELLTGPARQGLERIDIEKLIEE